MLMNVNVIFSQGRYFFGSNSCQQLFDLKKLTSLLSIVVFNRCPRQRFM